MILFLLKLGVPSASVLPETPTGVISPYGSAITVIGVTSNSRSVLVVLAKIVRAR